MIRDKKYKYLISVDLGSTGFISLCKLVNGIPEVICSDKIATENKDIFIYKKTDKKSDLKIPLQVSYSLNSNIIEDYINQSDTLEQAKADIVILVEQLTLRPGSKASGLSMFQLSDTGAVFRCLAQSFNIDYLVVPPATWKKDLGIDSEKESSINLFNKLIVSKNLIMNSKRKDLKNHNLIESMLIGYWYFTKVQANI